MKSDRNVHKWRNCQCKALDLPMPHSFPGSAQLGKPFRIQHAGCAPPAAGGYAVGCVGLRHVQDGTCSETDVSKGLLRLDSTMVPYTVVPYKYSHVLLYVQYLVVLFSVKVAITLSSCVMLIPSTVCEVRCKRWNKQNKKRINNKRVCHPPSPPWKMSMTA